LEEFALYSFNKSHSLCYATIAFRTLYAKYYAPAEFIMACIRTNPDDAGLYVAEGRRLGITVRPPDIRKSEVDVAVKDDAIYFGLSNVKGVKNAAAYIKELAERHNVWSLEDFQQALALESEDWTARKKAHKESGNPAQFKEPSPKMRCKSNLIEALNRVGAFDAYVERSVSMSVIQEAEKELLGIILTDNSDEAFANNQDLVDECDEYQWFQDSVSATAARLPGTIVNIRPVKTKAAGKDMGIIKIEWGSETIEFAVFPQQWMAYKFLWKERTPGIFMLKKTDRGIHFEDGMKLS
jgi:DNA polymerase-3 subunit alpha